MIPKTKTFLVTKDTQTIQAVQKVANNGSAIAIDQVLPDMSHACEYLEQYPVTTGIIDIDPDPQGILNELGYLIQRRPEVCTVVVSTEINQELILSAMQIGARHFLQKGSVQNDLSGVMGRLLLHTGQKRVAGSVVTVFSASGGCGATTVALNLAMEMRLHSSKPVLMVDLDRICGAVSTYLDVNSKYGIDDVLNYAGKIDGNLLESSSAFYMDNFDVLLSFSEMKNRDHDGVRSENLKTMIQACRDTYAYTIIDAPRMDEQTIRELSELSDFTIVVFQLTVKDIKFARAFISKVKTMGVPEKKIVPLVNRYEKRGHLIHIDDWKRAIGTDTLFKIRSDWKTAISCQNKGKTLAEIAPRSAIRKDYQQLAMKFQDVHAE
jgi:pilus assembly protein CpaE